MRFEASRGLSLYCLPDGFTRLETFHAHREAGIESRPLICGSMGLQPFWVRKYGEHPQPMVDQVHDNGLYLPNHANLDEEKIAYVADVFNRVAVPFNPICR